MSNAPAYAEELQCRVENRREQSRNQSRRQHVTMRIAGSRRHRRTEHRDEIILIAVDIQSRVVPVVRKMLGMPVFSLSSMKMRY